MKIAQSVAERAVQQKPSVAALVFSSTRLVLPQRMRPPSALTRSMSRAPAEGIEVSAARTSARLDLVDAPQGRESQLTESRVEPSFLYRAPVEAPGRKVPGEYPTLGEEGPRPTEETIQEVEGRRTTQETEEEPSFWENLFSRSKRKLGSSWLSRMGCCELDFENKTVMKKLSSVPQYR